MISRISMAMPDSGRSLVDASQDPELQDIARSRHGVRSGVRVTGDPLLNAIEQIQG